MNGRAMGQYEEWDLLAISHVLGGLVFKKGSEREQFRKRFTMFQDVLRESWVYQEIGQEFLEKGLEQGLEKGLAKGLEQGFAHGREEERRRRAQDHRQIIMSLVKLHFPEIAELATQQVESIDDPELLQTLSLKLLAIQKLDEAKQLLFEAAKH